jgi:hypothetical protein
MLPCSIQERIAELREEIAAIRAASEIYRLSGRKTVPAAAEEERRLQRLQEILDEFISLTDWRKP